MDSESMPPSYEDNREVERSRLSQRSVGKGSEVSLKTKPEKNMDRGYNESAASDRARTRTRDPDRDRISDYEKNSDHYYSDEYDNLSPSDRSRSLSPCSRSPSPSPRKTGRANQVTSRPLYRKGLQRAGSKQPRPGVHSQSLNKDSSPKDLDLVTKRVLSARLLKINEQRNELSELQLHLDQLQRENKVLRQLQHRQERALHKFEDTENEIAQLISRHNNEVHVLRERLRRSQERERATDRRLRDTEDELRRTKATLQKLRKLAEDRNLGEREELSRKLVQAQGRLHDSDRKVKELERNMELSSSSFQRQLAAERKKTHEVQDEVRNLREELERVTHKLKEKERELDTKNIYANRMVKAAPKKETDLGTKKKIHCSDGPARSSSKGVQTEDRMPSLDFPTPPPAVTDGPEYPKEDGYFSLKELQEEEQISKVTEEAFRPEKECVEKQQERHTLNENSFRIQEREKEQQEEDSKRNDQMRLLKEESRKGQSPSLFYVQRELEEDRKGTNQDLSLEKQEEERRRKEQLLAKMREIDRQVQSSDIFSNITESKGASSPPLKSPSLFPESKSQRPSSFGFPETVENLHKGLPSQDSSDSLRKLASSGRRGLKPQGSSDDLAFGSYAPSFGRPAGRAGITGQRAGGYGAGGMGMIMDGGEEKNRENKEVDFMKEKKSNLMQQLFGASANVETSSKMEILSPPPTRKPVQKNGSPFPWEATKKRDAVFSFEEHQSTAPEKSPLHVAETRPTVRAINSFDDDIEEVTL